MSPPSLGGHLVCVLLPEAPALVEGEVRVVAFAPFDEVVLVFLPFMSAMFALFESRVGGEAGGGYNQCWEGCFGGHDEK